MLEYMRLHSGGVHFVVEEASDPHAAARGVDEALRRIALVPHPEEGGSYVKYISPIEAGTTGPSFLIDMADAEAYPGVLESVLDAVVTALEDAGVDHALVTYPGDLRQRIEDAVRSGLVPPQLHGALRERVARGDDPNSAASWLAAESERLASTAYDEKPPPDPRDAASDEQWARAYALILAVESQISSWRSRGIPDSEVLDHVVAFLDLQKKSMDAEP